MPGKFIFTGNEDFREVRNGDLYFVDKTAIIKELVENRGAKVFLITRPRRFGKTLTMTMLREFFDIERQNSSALFEGLAISKEKGLCHTWMNQHPVLFLSLKEIKASTGTFAESYDRFCALVGRLCLEHSYLLKSRKVPKQTKKILSGLLDRTAGIADVTDVLRTLSFALHQHWGKEAIILIDEYDAPLAHVRHGENYDRLVSFIGNLLESGLKTNFSLEFAIMTGCLRIAKESVYTGLNHVRCYGVDEPLFADKFGFTAEEVKKILFDTRLSHKEDDMRAWYDGYCFGTDQEIYCPWDVLMYIDSLQRNPDALPQTFWANTSGNDIVKLCIEQGNEPVKKEISALLSNGEIQTSLNCALTYDGLNASRETIWTLFYMTGYLTKVPGTKQGAELVTMRIPNKEIKKLFIRIIDDWFVNTVNNMDLFPFFSAFWNGDEKELIKYLSSIILKTVSCFDAYKEDYYHGFITGLFVKYKKTTYSSRECGHGFADIIITDDDSKNAAVIEIKRTKSLKELSSLPDIALQQIHTRQYDEQLCKEYENVLHWGFAFCGKYCLAKCEVVKSMQDTEYGILFKNFPHDN